MASGFSAPPLPLWASGLSGAVGRRNGYILLGLSENLSSVTVFAARRGRTVGPEPACLRLDLPSTLPRDGARPWGGLPFYLRRDGIIFLGLRVSDARKPGRSGSLLRLLAALWSQDSLSEGSGLCAVSGVGLVVPVDASRRVDVRGLSSRCT